MEKYIDRSGLSERDGKGEYADAVFLVTSGEYMALYAANNILRESPQKPWICPGGGGPCDVDGI